MVNNDKKKTALILSLAGVALFGAGIAIPETVSNRHLLTVADLSFGASYLLLTLAAYTIARAYGRTGLWCLLVVPVALATFPPLNGRSARRLAHVWHTAIAENPVLQAIALKEPDLLSKIEFSVILDGLSSGRPDEKALIGDRVFDFIPEMMGLTAKYARYADDTDVLAYFNAESNMSNAMMSTVPGWCEVLVGLQRGSAQVFASVVAASRTEQLRPLSEEWSRRWAKVVQNAGTTEQPVASNQDLISYRLATLAKDPERSRLVDSSPAVPCEVAAWLNTQLSLEPAEVAAPLIRASMNTPTRRQR